ncbi:MAG TPA: right-handed parallel beta-helix repeat-containing protein [Gemmataceae bacterium]|nr:right-handed parallel beta-helix repeat-containing protein [Gemmataceae bacterium]
MPATLDVPSQYATIGAAVTAASSGDTILVAASSPYSAEGIVTSKSLTIQSASGAASTIIDCGSSGSQFGTFSGSNVTIEGFTFENCTNSSGVIGIRGSATISDCVFSNNDEGANFNAACINTNGNASAVITNCTFDHNKGFAAVEAAAGATNTITNCTFTNNTGEFGSGAIYANTATGTITGCTFTNNVADSTEYGGAIYWVNGSLSVTQSTFTNNSSPAAGGAIEIGSQGANSSLTLTQCNFTGNSAPHDGAVGANVSSTGTTTITATNCVFIGNKASVDGAAIGSHFITSISTNISIINSSFFGNEYTGSSPSGQGTVEGDRLTTLTILNSILYGDQTPVELSTLNVPNTVSVTYSDIQGGFAGAGNINANPLYYNPANGDLRLTAASPAIGAGTTVGAPTTDYLGDSRGAPPDMGAYETPTTVYVDQLFAGTPTGTSPAKAPTGLTLQYGGNAFSDIQSGLDALASGGTLVIFADDTSYSGGFTVNNPTTIDFNVNPNNGATLGRVTIATGNVVLNQDTVFTQAPIPVAGNPTLAAANLAFSAGNIVTGGTPVSLTVNANNNYDIFDQIGTAADKLSSFDVASGSLTELTQNIYTTGGQTYDAPTELLNNLTLTGTLVTITNGLTLGATATTATDTLTINGSLSLASTATVSATFNSAAVYGHIVVSGNTAYASAAFSLKYGGTYKPATGAIFTVISNGTTGSSGQFANVAQGSNIINGTTYVATYTGGSGNNFVLTAGGIKVVPVVTTASPAGTRLEVKLVDGAGKPLVGVAVTFTAPLSGATGRFFGGLRTVTVVTNALGIAMTSLFVPNTIRGIAYNLLLTVGSQRFNLLVTNLQILHWGQGP